MSNIQRVAVATKDGISINVHFGHAKTFWIYEKQGEQFSLVEKRDVDNYCLGNYGDQSAMQKILVTIKDCNAMLCAKIGDGPTEKLEKIGVKAVADYAYEAIEAGITQYVATL